MFYLESGYSTLVCWTLRLVQISSKIHVRDMRYYFQAMVGKQIICSTQV